ncbi:MAG: AAA family ATPase [Actinophytocola sp.]|uniref:AAA family ATPase n=1 Tax=Actinophytocola sp. TaxID=1872138 RepID=UPI003D6A06DD
MPGYILTGTPGSGKTAVLRQLELDGHRVVEEAATDTIALANACGEEEPWREPAFVDQVVRLQRRRRDAARVAGDADVFFDRSPVCTLALCHYLGFATPPVLVAEVERAVAGDEYEPTVFFVRNLGFVRHTEARRISLADSLVFERLHERTYRGLGFQLVDVPAGPLPERVALVRREVERLAASRP